MSLPRPRKSHGDARIRSKTNIDSASISATSVGNLAPLSTASAEVPHTPSLFKSLMRKLQRSPDKDEITRSHLDLPARTSQTLSLDEKQSRRFKNVKGKLHNNVTFSGITPVQELSENLPDPVQREQLPAVRPSLVKSSSTQSISTARASSSVCIMRFSVDGRDLACGREDGSCLVYRTHLHYTNSDDQKNPSISIDNLFNLNYTENSVSLDAFPMDSAKKRTARQKESVNKKLLFFDEIPHLVFYDHTAAITDISWSTGGFFLTSSQDKSVKLYHVNLQSCLCTFKHSAPVLTVRFHTLDETYFVTGSQDGRLRTWSISEKKLVCWNEVKKNSITAVSFAKNASIVVAGTSTGLCVFFTFQGLQYNTQINISGKASSKSKQLRVTGIENMPNPIAGDEKLLVSSSDSRVRLINIRDKSLDQKYRGMEIRSRSPFATFSANGRYIVGASEDKYIVIWDTLPKNIGHQLSRVLGGVIAWQNEGSKAHGIERIYVGNNPTCCVFAPWTAKLLDDGAKETSLQSVQSYSLDFSDSMNGAVLVVADLNGKITVYENSAQARRYRVESSQELETERGDSSVSDADDDLDPLEFAQHETV